MMLGNDRERGNICCRLAMGIGDSKTKMKRTSWKEDIESFILGDPGPVKEMNLQKSRRRKSTPQFLSDLFLPAPIDCPRVSVDKNV